MALFLPSRELDGKFFWALNPTILVVLVLMWPMLLV
jgi:hypothetical protein